MWIRIKVNCAKNKISREGAEARFLSFCFQDRKARVERHVEAQDLAPLQVNITHRPHYTQKPCQ